MKQTNLKYIVSIKHLVSGRGIDFHFNPGVAPDKMIHFLILKKKNMVRVNHGLLIVE